MISLPSIEQIVGSYNIRYDKLLELIPTYFAGSTATEINLYIDATPIIKRCSCEVSDAKDKSIILTSSIINMCAHYRQFFKSRLGVYTNIFVVLSGMTSLYNRKYVDGYNNAPQSGNFDLKMVNSAVDYLTLLTKYIQDIYFVQTEFEAGVSIYDLIKSKNNNNPDIILTKDVYDYQLAFTGAAILRPKKSTNGDVSYIFGNDDAVMVYLMERKVLSVQCIAKAKMLSSIMALTRLPERGIKSMKSIPTVIKAINSSIDKGLIPLDCNDIHYICEILNHDGANIKDFDAECRFNAIDILTQYTNLSFGGYSISLYDKVNLYDPNSLKDLNNNEFRNHPLDIMSL